MAKFEGRVHFCGSHFARDFSGRAMKVPKLRWQAKMASMSLGKNSDDWEKSWR